MSATHVVLTTAKNSPDVADRDSPYDLKWRQGKLLVSRSAATSHLPALQSESWLKTCLEHSPIRTICLDPSLSEADLKFWADLGEQTGKPVYLRIPAMAELPQKRLPWGWFVKRLLDRLIALLLLLILSPLLLTIAVLVRQSSPGSIFFKQWRVGHRGQLFRIIKFRTMISHAEQLHHQIMGNQPGQLHKCKDDPRVTSIGRNLRRWSLDELPQLINVLGGEMSLVGPRPWALYDAVRIQPQGQRRLNALPGITGAWQVEARSTLLDLDAVNQRDIEYLQDWSLWWDFKLLLRTIPKVFAGFGAY